MKSTIALVIVSLAALCSGCSMIENKVLNDVKPVAIDDLKSAIAMAQAAGDKDAVACYTDIYNHFQALQPGQQPDIKGAFSALEAARVAALAPPVAVPADVHKDCAVIVVDAQETALRLGLKFKK